MKIWLPGENPPTEIWFYNGQVYIGSDSWPFGISFSYRNIIDLVGGVWWIIASTLTGWHVEGDE